MISQNKLSATKAATNMRNCNPQMKTINYEVWMEENATFSRETKLTGKLLYSQSNTRACQQLLTGTNSTPGDLKAELQNK